MSPQTQPQRMIGMTLVLLLLLGCGAPAVSPPPPEVTPVPPAATPTPRPPTAAPTQVPPTATPTRRPPTATPTQVFTLATSAEEIAGTWVGAGNYYIRFDKDGTYRQAHALARLDQPYAISSYQFEGTKLVTTEIKVSGVPSCGKRIGAYEIRLLENGKIQIVAIKDECAQRAGDTAGEYEPVR